MVSAEGASVGHNGGEQRLGLVFDHLNEQIDDRYIGSDESIDDR